MELTLKDNTLIHFETKRVGKADLKKDGGTHRGRHTVRVTMLIGSDYSTVASLDYAKAVMADKNKDMYREMIRERNPDFEFRDGRFNVVWGDVISSLQDTAHGIEKRNHSLEAYDEHPCGISGVLVHRETGDIYISGIQVKEEIIERDPNGDARQNKRTPKALLKSEIKKVLELMTGKWRQYKLPSDCKINGWEKVDLFKD